MTNVHGSRPSFLQQTATASMESVVAEAAQLRGELRVLQKGTKLKDDTIAFLQAEKERLSREIKHYERATATTETETGARLALERENARLREECDKLRETVRRQKTNLRLLGNGGVGAPSGATTDEQRACAGSLVRSACALLGERPPLTKRAADLRSELETNRGRFEAWMCAAHPDVLLDALSLLEKALSEIIARRRTRSLDFPVLGGSGAGEGAPAVLRYAGGQSGLSSVWGSLGAGPTSESLMLARRRSSGNQGNGAGRAASRGSSIGGDLYARKQSAAARRSENTRNLGKFVTIDSTQVLPGLKPQ